MILAKIDEQIELARAGKPNGLMFKTNSVTDKDIIDKIAEASQAGVHATLFVRGISCLVPGVEGYTDNVKVVSIVGRLLEHSRIYGFGPRDNREIYLSSADLMTRNMEKRVEIAWPIINPELKERVNEYLDTSLSDTAKLRMLKSDLSYTPLEFFATEGPDGIPESFDSQEYLIKKAREDYLHSLEVREEQAALRSATARVQRIRDREMKESPVTPLVENPETGEPLTGTQATVPETDESLQEAATNEQVTLEIQAEETPLQETAVEIPADTSAQASVAQAAAQTSSASATGGIEEIEPGVAGPSAMASASTPADTSVSSGIPSTSTEADPAQTQMPSTQTATPEVEVLSGEQKATDAGAIQLVPKKPSLWTRIKFLFTGKLS